MHATIDGAGRVVIPKPVRERLGLVAGTRLEVVASDDGVHLRPRVPLATVEERDGRLVGVSTGPVEPIDDATVQALRDTLAR